MEKTSTSNQEANTHIWQTIQVITEKLEYRIYSNVTRGLQVFFFIILCSLQSRAAHNQGRPTIISLVYRKV